MSGPHRTISVVIPAFNAEATIGRAIESVVADAANTNGGPDVDVVVVDDGSTDATATAVEMLADRGITLVRQANAGASAARNAGAARATGRYVTFLDADDEAMPGWLSRYGEVLRRFQAPLARCAVVGRERSGDRIRPAQPFRVGQALPRGTPSPPSMVLTHELFERAGGYEESLKFGENSELLSRLAQLWQMEPFTVPIVDSPGARIHRRDRDHRSARYDGEPARTARYMLDRHADLLRPDHELRRDYHAIIGADHLRNRRRIAAAASFAEAIRARPLGAKNYGRLASTVLPLRR